MSWTGNTIPHGTSSEWKPCTLKFPCHKCGKGPVEFRIWESSDGAYEDYHYRCTACGHDWWVDGDDG